jgi:hypothetical protein
MTFHCQNLDDLIYRTICCVSNFPQNFPRFDVDAWGGRLDQSSYNSYCSALRESMADKDKECQFCVTHTPLFLSKFGAASNNSWTRGKHGFFLEVEESSSTHITRGRGRGNMINQSIRYYIRFVDGNFEAAASTAGGPQMTMSRPWVKQPTALVPSAWGMVPSGSE